MTVTSEPIASQLYERRYENVAIHDDILVGAHYYPWYSADTHWDEGRTDTPIRGDYDSRDSDVINQHIDEATGHGIDFFNVSWWGPGSWEDVTIRDHFLESDLIDEISFTIFYETVGRLTFTSDTFGHLTVNLDDPANRSRLIDDFSYLAENYFGHPSYLKLDGKVIAPIHLTRTFTGDVAGVIDELRSAMRDLGHELFIVADEVYWHAPNEAEVLDRIGAYDAVFAYNMHYSNSSVSDRFFERSLSQFEQWHTASETAGVVFVPNPMPGFDKRFTTHPNQFVIERSPNDFYRFFVASMQLLGDHGLMLVTSFNEWHEGTQIEPSIEFESAMLLALLRALNTSHMD